MFPNYKFEIIIFELIARVKGLKQKVEDFSSRIKSLRKERGMKQSEMAEILGLKERSYQCYEYRERYPDVPGLVAIADFFNVSLDYLMGRSDVRERQ